MGTPKEDIVTLIARLPDGSSILEHSDGRIERSKSRTDWARVDALTDEEIEVSIANDADWAEFRDIDWADTVLVAPPKKTAISIRVDDDVLNFFKKGGEGYQRRMNSVLRSYMDHKSKPKKRA